MKNAWTNSRHPKLSRRKPKMGPNRSQWARMKANGYKPWFAIDFGTIEYRTLALYGTETGRFTEEQRKAWLYGEWDPDI